MNKLLIEIKLINMLLVNYPNTQCMHKVIITQADDFIYLFIRGFIVSRSCI